MRLKKKAIFRSGEAPSFIVVGRASIFSHGSAAFTKVAEKQRPEPGRSVVVHGDGTFRAHKPGPSLPLL